MWDGNTAMNTHVHYGRRPARRPPKREIIVLFYRVFCVNPRKTVKDARVQHGHCAGAPPDGRRRGAAHAAGPDGPCPGAPETPPARDPASEHAERGRGLLPGLSPGEDRGVPHDDGCPGGGVAPRESEGARPAPPRARWPPPQRRITRRNRR